MPKELNYKQRVFGGHELTLSQEDIEDIGSRDCSNIRIENPIGAINNDVGITKWNTLGAGNPILALWQLPKHSWTNVTQDLFYLYKDATAGTGYWSYGVPAYVWSELDFGGTYSGNPTSFDYDTSTEFFYIFDFSNSQIVKVKIDGSSSSTFGTNGSGSDQFSTNTQINYNSSDDTIYFSDTGNNRIGKTQMDGTGWTTYTGLITTPRYLFYNSSTNVFYFGNNSSQVNLTKTEIMT